MDPLIWKGGLASDPTWLSFDSDLKKYQDNHSVKVVNWKSGLTQSSFLNEQNNWQIGCSFVYMYNTYYELVQGMCIPFKLISLNTVLYSDLRAF